MAIGETEGTDADRSGAAEDFGSLWHELDQERQSLRWTRRKVAQEISQLSGQQVATKTVHDRMRYGRRILWSEACWYVQALGLDVDLWQQRWERAEELRRAGQAASDPEKQESSDRPEQGSTPGLSPTPEPAAEPPVERPATAPAPTSRRRRIVVNLGAGISGAIVVTVGFWGYNALTNDKPDALACARISVRDAGVYRSPGAAKTITTKLRGEKISYPREMPLRTGQDGRRYRMVRTPTRTPSGYAYMLVDNLRSSDC
jgi:hypothetical protein